PDVRLAVRAELPRTRLFVQPEPLDEPARRPAILFDTRLHTPRLELLDPASERTLQRPPDRDGPLLSRTRPDVDPQFNEPRIHDHDPRGAEERVAVLQFDDVLVDQDVGLCHLVLRRGGGARAPPRRDQLAALYLLPPRYASGSGARSPTTAR